MEITNEIPGKKNGNDRVAGLSRKANKDFWMKEQNFNYYWYLVVSVSILVLSQIFNTQLFARHFDIDLRTYVLVQAFNVFHCTYMIFYFLHNLYTTQIFFLEVIYYFSLKFKHIARRLNHLNSATKTKKINNQALAKLTRHYNLVHLELIETNDFFKNFLGVNMLFFFVYALIVMFLVIFMDWLLTVTLLLIVFALFLTIIFVPFAFSTYLSVEVI